MPTTAVSSPCHGLRVLCLLLWDPLGRRHPRVVPNPNYLAPRDVARPFAPLSSSLLHRMSLYEPNTTGWHGRVVGRICRLLRLDAPYQVCVRDTPAGWGRPERGGALKHWTGTGSGWYTAPCHSRRCGRCRRRRSTRCNEVFGLLTLIASRYALVPQARRSRAGAGRREVDTFSLELEQRRNGSSARSDDRRRWQPNLTQVTQQSGTDSEAS